MVIEIERQPERERERERRSDEIAAVASPDNNRNVSGPVEAIPGRFE